MCRSSGRTPATISCPSCALNVGRRSCAPSPSQHETVRLAQSAAEEIHRGIAEKAGDEQIHGPLVDVHRRVDLLNDAAIQHDDALPERHRLDLIVRDVDHRRAERAMQPRDLGARRGSQLRIEIRQRLVEQEHLRMTHQRAAERDALALAAGELPRQSVHELRQLQRLGRLLDSLLDLRGVVAAQLEPEAEIALRPSCADTARSSGTPSRCRGRAARDA